MGDSTPHRLFFKGNWSYFNIFFIIGVGWVKKIPLTYFFLNFNNQGEDYGYILIMISDVWSQATRDDFPSRMQEIVDLIGLDAVVSLYCYFSENRTNRKDVVRRVYVPKKVKADHRLAQLIGVENLTKLSFEWGGLWIDLPHCKGLFKRVRDEQIRYMLGETLKKSGSKTDAVFSVAREFNLSAETIKGICRGGEG